jgi:hypothetical protein
LPILLGGPSGSGKSSLGQFLEGQGWLHLEADKSGTNGIDDLGLHEVWDSFDKQCNSGPLAQELEQRRVKAGRVRVILTLPSTPLSASHLERAGGVLLIRFLAGPPEACLRSFMKREAAANEAHWNTHNKDIIAALNDPAYARYKLAAFHEDGLTRVTWEVLARRLFELSWPSDNASIRPVADRMDNL